MASVYHVELIVWCIDIFLKGFYIDIYLGDFPGNIS